MAKKVEEEEVGRRRISMTDNNNVLCHIWQAPLTRMYISRRKCEMVLAVAKKHHPVARVMYMIEYEPTTMSVRDFWVVARALLGSC